jgi:hypothetical protein
VQFCATPRESEMADKLSTFVELESVSRESLRFPNVE